MPPKRKQVDDSGEAPAPTRTTRGSKAAAKQSAAADGAEETSRVAKKAKTTTAPKKTAASRRKAGPVDEEPAVVPRKIPSLQKLPAAVTNTEPISLSVTQSSEHKPAPKASAPMKKPGKAEPYTPARALQLFDTYADKDDPSVIGPEGFEELCTEAEMPLEGARPLIFAWQFGAKEMAKISKDEWVAGTANLKISSPSVLSLAMAELEDLLFKGKVAKASGKEYDRTSYNTHAANPKAAFQKLYMFSFQLVKPEQSKNIDMETSVAFWTVLLVPKYPIMGDIVEFINEKKGSYKATNKDLWSMMLEFCETVKPTLQDYEADGAWPTLLDDFVAWKTSQG